MERQNSLFNRQGQLKTPLKSEPFEAGQQWCFSFLSGFMRFFKPCYFPANWTAKSKTAKIGTKKMETGKSEPFGLSRLLLEMACFSQYSSYFFTNVLYSLLI